MKPTHTPGPWHVDAKGGLRGANGEPIYCKGADYALMVSAPELLQALIMMERAVNRKEPLDALQVFVSIERAQAAIKKATKEIKK